MIGYSKLASNSLSSQIFLGGSSALLIWHRLIPSTFPSLPTHPYLPLCHLEAWATSQHTHLSLSLVPQILSSTLLHLPHFCWTSAQASLSSVALVAVSYDLVQPHPDYDLGCAYLTSPSDSSLWPWPERTCEPLSLEQGRLFSAFHGDQIPFWAECTDSMPIPTQLAQCSE